MNTKTLGYILLLLAFSWTACKTVSKTVENNNNAQRLTIPPDTDPYVKQYVHIAVAEMERTGIPASIKMAQGILESNYGKSSLAQEANNHFGIKCGGNWQGETYHKKDDEPGLSCFRKYNKAEQSYYDHSAVLEKDRYKFLFQLERTDYKGWARGLQKAGYATSQTYAEKLIGLIERLGLHRFDTMKTGNGPAVAGGGTTAPQQPNAPNGAPTGTGSVGRLQIFALGDAARYLEAPAGSNLREIAEALHLRPSRLAQYNETDEKRVLKERERIWITPKRNRYPGKDKAHYATAGQTLYEVAQLYGVRLAPLAKRNALPTDAVLGAGQQVRLK